MYSFDETHYLSLKQGENIYEKKNYIGIALCCTGCQRNTDMRQGTMRQTKTGDGSLSC